MTDEQLAELALEYKAMDTRMKKAEAAKSKLKAKLLAEMDRRKTTGIVTNGVKITKVQQHTTEYDEKRLRRALGVHWKDAVREVVDKDLLSALVQEGVVPLARIARCSTEVDKAAYPLVSVVD